MNKHYLFLISIICFLSSILSANEPTLSIENEFIKVVANNSDAHGRFALETTLGNPDTITDDFQDLIYGKPTPWTSYTTLLIDNVPYIFGNPDSKLERWSNSSFNYINITEQFVSGNTIVSIGQYDTINVKQTLSFYKNPNTNLHDSILINYIITNESVTEKSIGLRCLLDTKLGKNDGAPLHIGHISVSNEIKITQNNIVDYWQAFDHLTSPNIIAQGLFQDASNTLTLPDYLLLANWGNLAEEPWSPDYMKGRSFQRKGETQKDTALAIYKKPITISPQQSLTFNTVYGLGGISLSAGELSLGLSAPKKRLSSETKPFLIMAYVYNASGYDAHNIKTAFNLSNNIEIIKGLPTKNYSILKKDAQLQIPLLVKLTKSAFTNPSITFKVESTTLNDNQITHHINLLSPSLTFTHPDTINISNQAPYQLITSSLKNTSQLPIENINITIKNIDPKHITIIEPRSKTIDHIAPYQSTSIDWLINTNNLSPTASFTQEITSPLTNKLTATSSFITTKQTTPIIEQYSKSNTTAPAYLTLKINTKQLKKDRYTLTMDPTHIAYTHYSTADLSDMSINITPTALTFTNPSNANFIYLHFVIKTNSTQILTLSHNQTTIDSIQINASTTDISNISHHHNLNKKM